MVNGTIAQCLMANLTVQEQKHESAGAYQIPQLVQSIHLNIILPKLNYMGIVWSHKWDTIKEVDLD